MTRIFILLMILSVTLNAQAQSTLSGELAYVHKRINDPTSETGINIYPTVVSSELNIEVADKLAGGKVTVSVFNAVGEIVLESVLGLGLNKIYVSELEKGAYVAVVRENGVYTSKSDFEVK